MTHTIVYLDQNYLSNMAKARIGRIKDDDQAKFWLSLFNDLKKAVLADKIACPELEFQRHEASYDRRLEEPIRKVIDEISWGLKFHLSTQILESQIYDAAKNFMGKQPEERKPWAIAFRSNPHAPIESRTTDIWGIKGRVNVHLPYLYEVVEHDRQLKSQFANDAESQKYDYTDLDWPDVVKAEKISFIISLFGLQAKDMIYEKLHSNSWLEQSIAVSLHAEFKKRWKELSEIGVDITNHHQATSFLMSEELFSIPHVDIFCSIHATINKHYPNRKRKQGDFYDIPILSTVLPYCDVVTTDSFMKEVLVKKLHFDDKYKARIFSATKADRLAFQRLVKTLI